MKRVKKVSVKTILKILWIVYACYSLICWLPMIDRLISKDYEQISQCISLNDSWNIRINGVNYDNISLEDFRFPPVNVSMKRALPASPARSPKTAREGVMAFPCCM